MQFEKNLVLLRKKNNLSQEELAFAIGVTRQTIYTWEAGLNYPTIVMLKKIADVLNVSTDELLNGFEVNRLPKSVKGLKLTKLGNRDGSVKYEELPNWFIKLKPEEEVCWGIYDIKGDELIRDYSYHVYTRGEAVIHDTEAVEIEVKEYDENLSLSRVYSQFISMKDDGVAWVGESSMDGDTKIIRTYKDQSFLDDWGINGKFEYQKTHYSKAEDYQLEYEGKKINVTKISYYDSNGTDDSKHLYIEVFLNQKLETLVWRRSKKVDNDYKLEYYVLTSRL